MKVLLLSLKTHSHMVYFNLGLAYLVAAFRTVGIEPDLALLDAGRMNRDDLRKQLQENSYDFVGMGFLFDNLPRVLEYMELISSASPDSKVLIGGPGPSSCPEYMLKKTGADILVQGEAEMIVPHLFTNLPEAGHSYTTKGIYWRIGDEVFTNGPGEIYMNLNDIPQPAWDAFPMQDYLKTARPPATTEDMYMPVLTSRGCPYNCNFCYHTNKFRYRDADKIAQEIVLLQERYGVTFVQFYDDLFMSSKKRCLELCDAFKRYDIDFRYRINGRVNIVDEEQLVALRETGCRAIGYGIESGDQAVLDFMNKKTTIAQILNAVKITKKHGFNVTTPVMFGQPNDTLESMHKTRDLLIQFIDGHEAQPRDIRRLTPYPGTTIYKWAVENGRLRDEEHFFELFKGAYNFGFNLTDLTDEEFESNLKRANAAVAAVWKEKRQELGS